MNQNDVTFSRNQNDVAFRDVVKLAFIQCVNQSVASFSLS